MQMTLFFFLWLLLFLPLCEESLPHTCGAARFAVPHSHCADAKLLLSAYSSFMCRVCLSILLHLQPLLTPPQTRTRALSRGAIHHLATRCPRTLPPTWAHLFPSVHTPASHYAAQCLRPAQLPQISACYIFI